MSDLHVEALHSISQLLALRCRREQNKKEAIYSSKSLSLHGSDFPAFVCWCRSTLFDVYELTALTRERYPSDSIFVELLGGKPCAVKRGVLNRCPISSTLFI